MPYTHVLSCLHGKLNIVIFYHKQRTRNFDMFMKSFHVIKVKFNISREYLRIPLTRLIQYNGM